METTEYVYDEAGRLVRSVTSREPEWDDGEQDKMLALAVYRDVVLCPCGCGGVASETLDPANDGKYRTGDPIRCQRRTALIIASEAHEKSPQRMALLYRTELLP